MCFFRLFRAGQFKQSQVVGGMESGGGKTISRTVLILTDSISLYDNRGMNDFQQSNLEEIVAQLRKLLGYVLINDIHDTSQVLEISLSSFFWYLCR